MLLTVAHKNGKRASVFLRIFLEGGPPGGEAGDGGGARLSKGEVLRVGPGYARPALEELKNLLLQFRRLL